MNDIDIVDRLRDLPSCHFLHGSVHNAMKDAAAEISDLRRQLAAMTERAEEYKRIGQNFEMDCRKHFAQSCANLERAVKAQADAAVLARECRAARAAISTEPVDWYSLADFQYPKLVSGGLLKKMGEARAATDANGALARGDGEKT